MSVRFGSSLDDNRYRISTIDSGTGCHRGRASSQVARERGRSQTWHQPRGRIALVAQALSTGSQWLRWDPHLHAPGTLRNDQYGGGDDATWDAYFRTIRDATPPVSAIGIADYFTLRSYKRFIQTRPAALRSVFVFANVEMRFTVQTRKGHGVNFHLLVCPDDPHHVEKAEEQLRQL